MSCQNCCSFWHRFFYPSVNGICCTPHQMSGCSLRPFLRRVQVQGCSPDMPGISKTALGPTDIQVLTVFVARPTERASMAQGLFYGGSGCRAVAHAHPAGSKNALGPVGIPLLGRLRRRAINSTLPKEVKAWGEGPLRPKDKFKIRKRRASQIQVLTSWFPKNTELK